MTETISVELSKYKLIIDFSDSTQKQNFKWVSEYVAKNHKKLPVQELVSFLHDAKDLHVRYLNRGLWLQSGQVA